MRFQNENENEKGGTWIFKMKILSVPFLKMKVRLDIAIFENENRICSFDNRKLRKCILKVLNRMRKVKVGFCNF